MNSIEVATVVRVLKQGGVIAYPTEGVFGFGCDPLNEKAVRRILTIKQRPMDKGLILIAACFLQVVPYVRILDNERMRPVWASWPGPVTWLLPKSKALPTWISGTHDSVAIRITSHPIAAELCAQFGRPLVSTSANRQGKEPLRDWATVSEEFGLCVDYIVPGKVGELGGPTEIRDAWTGQIVRQVEDGNG